MIQLSPKIPKFDELLEEDEKIVKKIPAKRY